MENITKLLETSIAGFKVEKLLLSIVMLVACLLITKFVMYIVIKAFNRSSLDKTLHAFLRAVIKVTLLFVTVIITMGTLGIPVTSLVALFSVVGLAVSLSIQGVLSNLAGGVQILVSKPFKDNDYVELNGIGGTATEIGLVHTKLTTIDNKVIFVPNSVITSAQIINYSANTSRRIEIIVNVSYECEIASVKAALLNAVKKMPHVLSSPAEPFAAVFKYGDSAIQYILRLWVPTPDYWDVYFALNEQIMTEFESARVTFPYNHLNVHVIEKK